MENILTAYGPLDRALIARTRIAFENDNERTLNLEYRLKNPLRLPDGRLVLPDEVVKRSAHIHLKRVPDGMESFVGTMYRSFDTRSRFTPTDTPPGEVSKVLRRLLARGVRFANSQAMCTSFKQEILNGSHAFGAQAANGTRTVTTKDVFKMALFLASGSLGAATTVYSTTSELAGSGNYTQGGVTVTNATAPTTSGTTGYWTPSASVSWANLTSSGSFDCALLYNSSSTSTLACAVFTFGAQSITAGTFTLTMPTNDSSNALIRIA